jgi:predicted RNA polymerase sigma factor
MRPELCDDALRLGRVLAGLAPREPEVHGLVALMEIQASRTRARVGPDGEPILLLDQNRARWDHLLIRRGLAALAVAEGLGLRGSYTLQAAIAACHAGRGPPVRPTGRGSPLSTASSPPRRRRPSSSSTAASRSAWPRAGRRPRGRRRLVDDPMLASYHLLPSVRGDLLFKLGRLDEARVEFARAASLTRNARERNLLLERAAACRMPTS